MDPSAMSARGMTAETSRIYLPTIHQYELGGAKAERYVA